MLNVIVFRVCRLATSTIVLWMKNLIKKRLLTVSSLLLATGFWFFDSFVHYFIYHEPEFEFLPGNFNELWMRLVIVSLMVLFGVFADYFSNFVSSREKLLELTCVYNDLMQVNVDVLTNQLDQMKLFKLEAQKSDDFDQEIIDLYDNAMSEIADLVGSLKRVVDITDTQINKDIRSREVQENYRKLYPQNSEEKKKKTSQRVLDSS